MRRWRIRPAALAGAALLLSCGKDNTGPAAEKTCAELGAEMVAAYGTTDPVYRVERPNGGEIYNIGDTVRVRVTSNMTTSAQVTVRLGASPTRMRLPGIAGNLSINAYANCDTVVFTVPATFTNLIGPPVPVTAVSESVKVRVDPYNPNPAAISDESDGFFSIR